MTPSTSWEPWRAAFKARVKEYMNSKGLRYRDFADLLGYGSPSMITVNLGERGPSLEFCERLEEHVPEFAGVSAEFVAARTGTQENEIPALQRTTIRLGLDALEAALGAALDAVRQIRTAVDPDADDEGATHEGSENGPGNGA